MELQTVTDVFCDSFAFGRSFTHPFQVNRFGNARVLRDAPRRSGPERGGEIVICTDSAQEAIQALLEHGRSRDTGCVITSDLVTNRALVDRVKAEGYRFGSTEAVFLRDLENIPEAQSEWTIRRVTTKEDADRLALAAKSRQILSSHLDGARPSVRAYVAEKEGEFVGWVRSIHVHPFEAYPSNLYVPLEHRRRGIATALMREMLLDDRRHGAQRSVLLASHAGAKLYPQLGYKQVGTLHLFIPRRHRG